MTLIEKNVFQQGKILRIVETTLIISLIFGTIGLMSFIFEILKRPRIDIGYTTCCDESYPKIAINLYNRSINTIEALKLNILIVGADEGYTYTTDWKQWKRKKFGTFPPSRQRNTKFRYINVDLGFRFEDYFISEFHEQGFRYPVYVQMIVQCKNMKDVQYTLKLENNEKVQLKKVKGLF